MKTEIWECVGEETWELASEPAGCFLDPYDVPSFTASGAILLTISTVGAAFMAEFLF